MLSSIEGLWVQICKHVCSLSLNDLQMLYTFRWLRAMDQ